MEQSHEGDERLLRKFSPWSVLCVVYNTVNIFGGLSYIFVVGISAGGIPSIIYGFIGSCICVTCFVAIMAEIASFVPTAGGSYHYALYLTPIKYRRISGYFLGWFNYLAWVLGTAAVISILASLVFAIVWEYDPTYSMSGRWQLFLVYVAFSVIIWLVNIFLLRIIAVLEYIGTYVSMAAFLGFFIALLAVSPKASPKFVFVEVTNDTGYSAASMAVVIGLFNSMTALVGFDSCCHLAEEVPRPTTFIPRILYLTVFSTFVVGLTWLLVIGFCISDVDTIINTPTGVPILELIKQATGSQAAETVFWAVLIINYLAAGIGCGLAASRQGFAFARDGGMFMNQRLATISPRYNVPIWSIHLMLLEVILVGLVFLFSTTGFNAILGVNAAFMILSYSSPSFVMLCTGRSKLPKTPFSLGKFGYVLCVVAVFYACLVTILVMFPSTSPIRADNMNYAVLIFCASLILMAIAWFGGARKVYSPPSLEDIIIKSEGDVSTDVEVIKAANLESGLKSDGL